MRIESLTKEHIPALCEMEKQCFGQTAWSEEGFLSELANKSNIFLTAIAEGQPIGCAALQNTGQQGFITKVMVSTANRRQGCAQALLMHMDTAAKQCGIKTIGLEVRASNEAAIALYHKCGYKDLGIRRNFYRFPKEDAVIMEKDL